MFIFVVCVFNIFKCVCVCVQIESVNDHVAKTYKLENILIHTNGQILPPIRYVYIIEEYFGSLVWSCDLNKLLFIGESVENDVNVSFSNMARVFHVTFKNKYKYVEHFGNDLEAVKTPRVFQFDLTTETVELLNVNFSDKQFPKRVFEPSNTPLDHNLNCPLQIYSNNKRTYVLVVCIEHFKSGIQYCDDVETKLYLLNNLKLGIYVIQFLA